MVRCTHLRLNTHLAQNLLVELEPRLVSLAVRVLEAEEPDFSQSDSFHHLDKDSVSRAWRGV